MIEKLPKMHVTFTFAKFTPSVERILVRVMITPNYTPGYNETKNYGWKIEDVVKQYMAEIPNSKATHRKYVKDELWGADDLSQAWKFLAFLTDAKIKRIKTGNPNGYGEQCDLSESETTLLKKCEKDLGDFKKLGLQPVYCERYEVVGQYVVVSMDEKEDGRTWAITIKDAKIEEAMLKIRKAQEEEKEKVEQAKRAKADKEKMNF